MIFGCESGCTNWFIAGISVASIGICVQGRENYHGMSKKKKPELKLIEESSDDEVIKLGTDAGDDTEVIVLGADDHKEEGDELSDEGDAEDSTLVAVVDDLLMAEDDSKAGDADLDVLFQEEKVNMRDEDEVALRKALYEAKESKASMMRNKSGEATKATLAEQVAMLDTLEDTWERELEGDLASKKTKFVVIALIIILVGLAIGGAVMVRNNQLANKEDLQKLDKEKATYQNLKEEAKKKVAKVEAAFFKFHAVKNVDDLVAAIADGESLREKVTAYYKKHPLPQKIEGVSITQVSQTLINDKVVWYLTFESPGSSESRGYFFREDGNGGYKVDWRAISGCQDENLADFLKKRSIQGKVFRFFVKKKYEDGFYNWGFNDERYAAFRLIDPETDRAIWGYVDLLDKELVDGMAKIFDDDSISLSKIGETLMLKVKFMKGSDPMNDNCVLIEKLVSPKWVDTRTK